MNDEAMTMETIKDPVAMAEESAGTTLLKALLTEVQQLQKPWANTPQAEQQNVIDRLRLRVEDAVREAVLRIASGAQSRIRATVESVTFKDGVKAVLQLSRGNPETHALADATGGTVLIVLTEVEEHVDGMHTVKPDPDQRELLSGHGSTRDTANGELRVN